MKKRSIAALVGLALLVASGAARANTNQYLVTASTDDNKISGHLFVQLDPSGAIVGVVFGGDEKTGAGGILYSTKELTTGDGADVLIANHHHLLKIKATSFDPRKGGTMTLTWTKNLVLGGHGSAVVTLARGGDGKFTVTNAKGRVTRFAVQPGKAGIKNINPIVAALKLLSPVATGTQLAKVEGDHSVVKSIEPKALSPESTTPEPTHGEGQTKI